MSGEDDNFISRWSRLKQQASEEKKKPRAGSEADDARMTDASPEPASGEREVVRAKPEPTFDPASLPPIDSIVAGSDLRAFLQKGVPAALTKAALRRAWTMDPTIRDFIEVAENQWDFTDPTAIPGFGPLQAGDRLRQLVRDAMGKLPEVPDAADPLEERQDAVATAAKHVGPESRSQGTESEEQQYNQDTADVAALQQPPAPGVGTVPRRRGHGGAMPR